MYKRYLVIVKKVMNNSDDFFKLTSFFMWFSIFFSFLFFVFKDTTIINIGYSSLSTLVVYIVYWSTFDVVCLYARADEYIDNEEPNVLKNSPFYGQIFMGYPWLVKLFIKWIFSIIARHRFYTLVDSPTIKGLHEKLMWFAGEENIKKFWLLYETSEALGLKRYLLPKPSHSSLIDRYALLYSLEQQVGSIGRDTIEKGVPDLWNEILKDLALQLAKKIAEYRTNFFVELCEETDDILKFQESLAFQKYCSRCEELLEKCSQHHTQYLSYLNSWYGIHQTFPEKENILAQEFIPSGETPKTIRNADGFRIRDFRLINLKDYFYGIKKTKLNEVY